MLDAVFSGLLIIPLAPLAALIDPDARHAGLTMIGTLVVSLVALVLLALFDGGERGATPGKRIVGIRVADRAGGGPIGTRRGLVRRLVYVLGGLSFYLGWLWVLIDRRGQAWHDKAAGTVVVRTR